MDSFLTQAAAPTLDLIRERTTKIHIHTRQNGRKWITTLEGLDDDLDLHRIARALKRDFHCSASVDVNEDEEEFIKLSGNHRDSLAKWLVDMEILTEREARERLVLHGA